MDTFLLIVVAVLFVLGYVYWLVYILRGNAEGYKKWCQHLTNVVASRFSDHVAAAVAAKTGHIPVADTRAHRILAYYYALTRLNDALDGLTTKSAGVVIPKIARVEYMLELVNALSLQELEQASKALQQAAMQTNRRATLATLLAGELAHVAGDYGMEFFVQVHTCHAGLRHGLERLRDSYGQEVAKMFKARTHPET